VEQCNEAVLALDAALKAQAEPVQEPVASRLKMHSHDVPTTMRTEFRPDEKAVLAPPHPGDFGIPKEHWEAAQHYANYWNENRAKAQPPEPAQEPVAWMYEARHIDSAWVTAVSLKHPGPEDRYVRGVTPLYTAPPQRPPEPIIFSTENISLQQFMAQFEGEKE
jgi:hypothetical protein